MAILVLLAALAPPSARAADYYWTNSAGGNFTNAVNWSNAVPTAADNANFANLSSYTVTWSSSVTNANAYFNSATNSTVTLGIGAANTWWLTNSFVVGQTAGTTSTVIQTSGSLVVTNAAGTGAVTIGSSGQGTLILSGGSLVTSNLTVGSSSALNRMIVSNGVRVTTTGGGTIGSAAGSFGNSVLVTGSGSVWSNTTSGTFLVGNSGSSNTLTIANGGMVYQNGGFNVGNLAGANNNSVLVTDTGSVLQTTSTLNLNYGALLMVANGGKLFSSGGASASVIGGSSSGNSNSTLVVAGPGSTWTNGGNVQIGAFGGVGVGNSLYVTNGGQATFGASVLYGTNNLVYLAGGGAFISNSANSTIGAGASSFNNKVRILAGATNWSSGVTVGGTAGASSNVLEVAGSGSLLSSANAINVGYTAFSGTNLLVVTNGGQVVAAGVNIGGATASSNSVGNAIYVLSGGKVISSGQSIMGQAAGGNSNTLVVAGGGSVWSNTSATSLVLGQAGSYNQMFLTNGGFVYASGGFYVGNAAGGSNNSVLVDNSVLSVPSVLQVGALGIGNQMIVTNGGQVLSTGATAIGSSAGANSNSVLVTGSGSLWNNAGTLTVGDSAMGNSLTINGGGSLISSGTGAMKIGNAGGASNNLLVISGIGSTGSFALSTLFSVGAQGGYNSLLLTNGGTLITSNSAVGSAASSIGGNNNSALVSGSGSVWSTYILSVGGYWDPGLNQGTSATSNMLTIANGGKVTTVGQFNGASKNASLIIGVGTGSGGGGLGADTNGIMVMGPGSFLNANGGYIDVGNGGAANFLVITNGGGVSSVALATQASALGEQNGASNNWVLVTGSGSVWSNSGVWVGGGVNTLGSGFGNNMTIAQSGMVVSLSNSRIGSGGGARSNWVTVTDPGSIWTNTGSLVIGNALSSALNSLLVTNGGSVFSVGGTIGNAGAANSNTVKVVGGSANSLWNLLGGAVTVGAAGTTGNVLTVSLGGYVTNAGTVVIGAGGTSLSNQLNVLGGTFGASSLLVTNAGNTVTFNSGTMNLGGAYFSNGVRFVVGDGQNAAVYNMLGGAHSFSNGLLIASNSWLTGSGSLVANPSVGGVFLTNGAVVSPGSGTNGIGTMTVNALNGINGSVYDVQLLDVRGTAGRSWDLLNVSGAITNVTASNGTNFIVRMDAMGTTLSGYSARGNYGLKILTFGTSLVSNNFMLDLGAFGNAASGAWQWVTNGNALYLVQSGFAPVTNYVWNGNNAGAWSATGNWASTLKPVAGGDTNATLYFGGSGSTAYGSTNDLVGTFTNNAIVLNSSSTARNILSGNPIYFAAGSNVAAGIYQQGVGSFAISNFVQYGGGLVFDGAGLGDLTLATNLTGSGAVVFQGGAYNTSLLGSNAFVGPVVLNSGGSVTISNQYGLGAANNVTISNGTLVANVSGGYQIGPAASITGVQFLVTGPGSVWSNVTQIAIGSPGSLNQLIITNGGLVMNAGTTTIVGSGSANATNNLVVVSGSGSMWTNTGTGLTIGSAAMGNQMVISAGGRVVNATAQLGSGAGGSNGVVLVTDPGSVWQITSGGMNIGSAAPGNQMIVTNGGWVISTGAGALGSSAGANNNSVLVSGAGSMWSNTTSLTVGSSGAGNLLTVNSSGLVVSTSLTIGNGSGANSNTVVIAGTGSAWRGSASLQLGANNAPTIGNALYVTNGGYAFFTYPVLYGTNSLIYLSDPGTVVTNNSTSTAIIGGLASGTAAPFNNRVRILNGATYYMTGSGGMQIGNATAATSTSNAVEVAGTGAALLVPSSSISLGAASGATGNGLYVTNGGYVLSAGATVGNSAGADGNFAVVSGSGSVWSNSASVVVGGTSMSNALYILNGGVVASASQGKIGGASNYNTVVVAGPGSFWNNYNNQLLLGDQNTAAASFNRLIITNYGTVYDTGVSIGRSAGGMSNSVFVASGGYWSNSGSIAIANNNFSTFNSLTISNGGLVYTLGTGNTIGSAVGANGNWALVTGSNAAWLGTANTSLGSTGSASNQLLVVNGGLVANLAGTIGNTLGTLTTSGVTTNLNSPGPGTNTMTTVSSNLTVSPDYNLAVVNGGTWTNTSTLTVGALGLGNSLVVSNGGVVVSAGGTIGSGAYLSSNYIYNITTIATNGGVAFSTTTNSATPYNTVTSAYNSVLIGAGGLWNSALLTVGSTSPGNSLTVTNGGNVLATTVTLGSGAGSSNNAVVVTGNGSVLSGSGALTVGNSGAFNRLTITNGGTVISSGTSAIGNSSGGNSNSVTVIGNGSVWTNGGQVQVGQSGAFNQMLVANSALVLNANMSIGNSSAGSISNLLTVSGSGTIVSNSYIVVGSSGSFNQLVISDGAKVISSGAGSLGMNASSSNNLAVVTGTNALWANASSTFYIGSAGLGNRLVVSNTGKLVTPATYIGGSASSVSNAILVSGKGSAWTNAGVNVGQLGAYNLLVVSNGGVMVGTAAAVLGNLSGSTGNVVLVTGNGSMWTNTSSITVGAGEMSNALIVASGGQVFATSLTAGSSAGSNSVLLTSGGLLDLLGSLTAGNYGGNTISNDGGVYQFSANNFTIVPNGYGRISLNNGTISLRGITNADVSGSLGGDQLRNMVFSGNNTFRLNNASNFSASPQNYTFAPSNNSSNYAGLEMINGGTAWKSAWLNLGTGGTLLVSNSTANIYGVFTNSSGTATVANASVTFWSNAVLNGGSLYQAFAGTNAFNAGLTINAGAMMTMDAFSTLTGAITNNSLLQILANANYVLSGGQGPAGNGTLVVSDGGTVSLTNGNFSGGLGGSLTNNGLIDVQNLGVLGFGGGSAAPAGTGVLRVGAGATVNFSPGSFTVGNTVSNLGTMNVSNAVVTYGGPVVISGLYASDPSTNIFTTNVVVTGSGALVGGNGDLFVFQKDLLMLSTNPAFSLSSATVLFTNGPQHLLSISNSGALNIGTGYTNFSQVASNFAIGTLSIAPGNRLTLTGNKDSRTNALYVGWLDIQGWSTNGGYESVTNALFAALNLPDVNMYYDYYDSRNQWLNDFVPEFGYDLWGGGLLLPIPEPSPFLALGAGLAVLAYLRRRKA